MKATRDRVGTLLALAMSVTLPAVAGTISYEAYAGVVEGSGGGGTGSIIGNGASGTGMNCTTFGPASMQLGSAFQTGVTFPAGGVQPCGYFGGALDNVGVSPQTASTGVLAATFPNSNSSTGNASASSTSNASGEIALSAGATTTFDGGGGYSSAGGAAGIDDPNWTISCPSCAAGMVLNPVYTFQISLNLTSNQNIVSQDPGGTFSAVLYMQQVGQTSVQDAFYTLAENAQVPSWLCYNNPVCPSFTVGPGSLSGTTTLAFVPFQGSITLGAGNQTTIEEAVAFSVFTDDNATADPTAVLTSVLWEDPNDNNALVSGVTLTTSEGVYANGGYTASSSATPEPVSLALGALGLMGAALVRRRARPQA
jgi:MYXO-CTERM domain-containing protein